MKWRIELTWRNIFLWTSNGRSGIDRVFKAEAGAGAEAGASMAWAIAVVLLFEFRTSRPKISSMRCQTLSCDCFVIAFAPFRFDLRLFAAACMAGGIPNWGGGFMKTRYQPGVG